VALPVQQQHHQEFTIMFRPFTTPLYIKRFRSPDFTEHDILILWEEPYPDCSPFYAFEDGLFCPVMWEVERRATKREE
jgi:hypothetical protein